MAMDVYETLGKLPHFKVLSDRQRRQLADVAMVPFEVGAGETLLVEGEEDDSMMLLVSGGLEVQQGDPPVVIAEIAEGELVGDMAMYSGEGRRCASVVTKSACQIILIERHGLYALREMINPAVALLEATALRALGQRVRNTDRRIAKLARGAPIGFEEDEGLLSKLFNLFGPPKATLAAPPQPDPVAALIASPAFAGLDQNGMLALAQRLIPVLVQEGEIITREAAVEDCAFIIGTGRVNVYRAKRRRMYVHVAELHPGAFFGLVSLVHGRIRSATCVAAEPAWLFKLTGEDYEHLEKAETPEALVLRQAVFRALCQELTAANLHLTQLLQLKQQINALSPE